MNGNLKIGTAVILDESVRNCSGRFFSIKRVGEVVEIGEGSNAGRLRVRWTHTIRDSGDEAKTSPVSQVKRTWVKADRLKVRVKMIGE